MPLRSSPVAQRLLGGGCCAAVSSAAARRTGTLGRTVRCWLWFGRAGACTKRERDCDCACGVRSQVTMKDETANYELAVPTCEAHNSIVVNALASPIVIKVVVLASAIVAQLPILSLPRVVLLVPVSSPGCGSVCGHSRLALGLLRHVEDANAVRGARTGASKTGTPRCHRCSKALPHTRGPLRCGGSCLRLRERGTGRHPVELR